MQQVTAYRTTGGKVFGDKSDAYHEEVLEMFRQLPKVSDRGYSMQALLQLTGEIQGWLDRCGELRDRLRSDPEDARVETSLKVFDSLYSRVKLWVVDANRFYKSYLEEPDPEVKLAVSKRG